MLTGLAQWKGLVVLLHSYRVVPFLEKRKLSDPETQSQKRLEILFKKLAFILDEDCSRSNTGGNFTLSSFLKVFPMFRLSVQ